MPSNSAANSRAECQRIEFRRKPAAENPSTPECSAKPFSDVSQAVGARSRNEASPLQLQNLLHEGEILLEWSFSNALFLDGKEIRIGPAPSYEKVKRLIEKRVRRL